MKYLIRLKMDRFSNWGSAVKERNEMSYIR